MNLWQPSAGRRPVAREPGQLFLFKLHASHGGAIVGGGFFAHYSALPIRMTWDTFGIENGAASFEEMVARIGRYRRSEIDIHADQVGCLVLVEPFFLDESEWIAPPAGWAPNIVQGKGYDSDIAEGARIWGRCRWRWRGGCPWSTRSRSIGTAGRSSCTRGSARVPSAGW